MQSAASTCRRRRVQGRQDGAQPACVRVCGQCCVCGRHPQACCSSAPVRLRETGQSSSLCRGDAARPRCQRVSAKHELRCPIRVHRHGTVGDICCGSSTAQGGAEAQTEGSLCVSGNCTSHLPATCGGQDVAAKKARNRASHRADAAVQLDWQR
eukprot:351479-Chlamydomonas_euryale.AAC.34